jgi:hypothetical protein
MGAASACARPWPAAAPPLRRPRAAPRHPAGAAAASWREPPPARRPPAFRLAPCACGSSGGADASSGSGGASPSRGRGGGGGLDGGRALDSDSSGGGLGSGSSSASAPGLAPFFDEQRVAYNRMRHERDRANRRARMAAARCGGGAGGAWGGGGRGACAPPPDCLAHWPAGPARSAADHKTPLLPTPSEAAEAQLAALPPEQRAALESAAVRARAAAAKAQAAAVRAALDGGGLRVVIDCSYGGCGPARRLRLGKDAQRQAGAAESIALCPSHPVLSRSTIHGTPTSCSVTRATPPPPSPASPRSHPGRGAPRAALRPARARGRGGAPRAEPGEAD